MTSPSIPCTGDTKALSDCPVDHLFHALERAGAALAFIEANLESNWPEGGAKSLGGGFTVLHAQAHTLLCLVSDLIREAEAAGRKMWKELEDEEARGKALASKLHALIEETHGAEGGEA